MAGFPRSDLDANNWQTVTPDDWSLIDHLKAYSSDARTALGNLGSNLLEGISPFHPDAAKAGAPSLQVPPMLQGIADSYSRLAGTPSKPGNAYDLTGVPELDAPIQGDMSNVLLSLYGGNAVSGFTKPKGALGAGAMREADDFVRMYHGTSSDAAAQIEKSGFDSIPFFVPSRDVALRYGDVALPIDVKKSALSIDADLPGSRLLSVDEANGYFSRDGLTIDDYLSDGRSSFGTEQRGSVRSAKTGETLFSDTGKPSLLGSALATAGEQPKGITAYHGSPHDFDKFSLDKIGTGEGAQAYGHGLYFADNEGVAGYYREALAPRTALQSRIADPVLASDVAELYYKNGGGWSDLVRDTEKEIRAWERSKFSGSQDHLAALRQLEALKGLEADPPSMNGHMYQVRINADPESFLDWDKPLSQQSQNARNALAAIPNSGPRYEAWDRHGNNVSVNDGATPYLGTYDEAIKAAGKGGRVVADESYNDLQSLIRGNEDKLKEAGIPGIRYLDGNSRGKGEGSSNYVVFDDSLIEILKKYGLAGGAVGAGALNALSQDPQIY